MDHSDPETVNPLAAECKEVASSSESFGPPLPNFQLRQGDDATTELPNDLDTEISFLDDAKEEKMRMLAASRRHRHQQQLGDRVEAPPAESSLPPQALETKPIMATVSRYNTTLDLEKKPLYTVYEIVVVYQSLRWSVWKRYSEFAKLHDELSKHPACQGIQLPKLPPRKIFGNMKEKFVEQRCAMLMVYWDELMHHVDTLSGVAAFLQFIGVLSTPQLEASPALPHLQERCIRIDSLMLMAQEGDIVLFQCGGVLPSLQRGLLRSYYDHVGVIVRIPEESTDPSSLCIMEATVEGVYSYTLHRRLCAWFATGAHMAYRQLRMNRTPEVKRALADFVEETDGKPYKLSATKLIFGGQDVKSNKIGDEAYFCSELVASVWKVMGVLPMDKSAAKYLPADFADAGGIQLNEGVELLPEILIQFKNPAVLFAEELPQSQTPQGARTARSQSERRTPGRPPQIPGNEVLMRSDTDDTSGGKPSYVPMGYPKALARRTERGPPRIPESLLNRAASFSMADAQLGSVSETDPDVGTICDINEAPQHRRWTYFKPLPFTRSPSNLSVSYEDEEPSDRRHDSLASSVQANLEDSHPKNETITERHDSEEVRAHSPSVVSRTYFETSPSSSSTRPDYPGRGRVRPRSLVKPDAPAPRQDPSSHSDFEEGLIHEEAAMDNEQHFDNDDSESTTDEEDEKDMHQQSARDEDPSAQEYFAEMAAAVATIAFSGEENDDDDDDDDDDEDQDEDQGEDYARRVSNSESESKSRTQNSSSLLESVVRMSPVTPVESNVQAETQKPEKANPRRSVLKAERDFTEYTLYGLNQLLDNDTLRRRANALRNRLNTRTGSRDTSISRVQNATPGGTSQ